ncbi:MAG: peptidase S41 [Melioribacter sp.]|nr:peptidase S41 [Melioribacter sp.]
MIKSIRLLIIPVLSIYSFSNHNNCIAQDTIKFVNVGNQVWMTENLNVSRFRNGDLIPEAKTDDEWEKAGQEEKPAWCYYDNNPENGKRYGKLYNWYAVNDPRGLAPKGWHIPNIYEFETFVSLILKDDDGLKAFEQGTEKGVITNKSRFSTLFGGRRRPQNDFVLIGQLTCFWSSTENDQLAAWDVLIGKDKRSIRFDSRPMECGHSVRCLLGEREISETKPKHKAVLDTTFNSGSKVTFNKLTKKTINDLTVLGKLWGFLKYYHPSASNGELNWDYELFRVMPKVLKSNSKEERNKTLSQWINLLGAIKEKQESSILDYTKIKFMPDIKWIEDETELGKEINTQLKEIKNAKRDSSNFYIGINYTFENENPYKKWILPDVGFRLLALFRYWNIIQYYYPYKNLIVEDWNHVLQDFIPEFVKSSNALEYHLTIRRLIEKIPDTHATITGYDRIINDYLGKYRAACKISFIENKAVVTDIYSKVDSTIQLKIGDIIEKVNGESVDDIVKRKLSIYPASNYPTKLRNISSDILRGNDEYISITYLRSGNIKTEKVKCVNVALISTIPTIDKKYSKILDNNIGYLFPGTINNSELPELMKSFLKCKAIIIDFRCYPSDNVFDLIEYLIPAPTQFMKFSMVNLVMPGMFIFNDPQTVGKNNPDYFKGKVVVIVNEITQSSAEFYSMALRKAPRATVIGSTTAGADGDIRDIILPGGIKTRISGFGVYYPDGGETQRIGIVPDVEIKPTIKGLIEGKDELLEKAIQIIIDDKYK